MGVDCVEETGWRDGEGEVGEEREREEECGTHVECDKIGQWMNLIIAGVDSVEVVG